MAGCMAILYAFRLMHIRSLTKPVCTRFDTHITKRLQEHTRGPPQLGLAHVDVVCPRCAVMVNMLSQNIHEILFLFLKCWKDLWLQLCLAPAGRPGMRWEYWAM